MTRIVPDNPEQWAALVTAMRDNLEGDFFKLVGFIRAGDGHMKLTVTKTTAKVTLPDGTKVPFDEWIGAAA